jgi:cobalamin biosynthesis Co2+ chelatase CbiK
MRKTVFIILLQFFGVLLMSLEAHGSAMTDKPVILLTAFGSTVPETKATYDSIGAAVSLVFPDNRVEWAFTSNIIRLKLRYSGKRTYSTGEMLRKLKAEGVRSVIIQSLHIIPGEEFEQILSTDTAGLNCVIGAPLLAGDKEIEEVVSILGSMIKVSEPTVFAAHGNETFPQYNEPLIKLGKMLSDRYPNVVLCTIDGPPGVSPLAKIQPLVKENGFVLFIPLMMVTGVHVHDDLLGMEPSSWKSMLVADSARTSMPLGEIREIQNIINRHIQDAIDRLEKGGVGAANTSFVPKGTTEQKSIEEQNIFSKYKHFKMALPFWPRKAFLMFDLAIMVILGIFIGQILEQLGVIKSLGFITYPVTRLGKLPPETSPAFLFALQSGAMANSMLAAGRDTGKLTKRETYTSVFVVSSMSLLVHLPTYVVPIGAALGWKATAILFGVRILAILVQLACILFVSRMLFHAGIGQARLEGNVTTERAKKQHSRRSAGGTFCKRVWINSKKTIVRFALFLIPTFFVVALLEQSGFFIWFAHHAARLDIFGTMPSQSAIIIGAQALNLYNGAAVAGSLVQSEFITTKVAVLVLLIGSLLTAPIRTLKHSMGSYVAVLGPRPGMIMAVLTQATRSFFLLLFIILLTMVWK